MDIKNIFDSVEKEIKSKFKDSYPTKQQLKKYKKHVSEFIKGVKFIYAHENFVIGRRSPKEIEFKSKLGFSQYDITLKKESSVLKLITNVFEGENMKKGINIEILIRKLRDKRQ